jgi:hypothetical protein
MEGGAVRRGLVGSAAGLGVALGAAPRRALARASTAAAAARRRPLGPHLRVGHLLGVGGVAVRSARDARGARQAGRGRGARGRGARGRGRPRGPEAWRAAGERDHGRAGRRGVAGLLGRGIWRRGQFGAREGLAGAARFRKKRNLIAAGAGLGAAERGPAARPSFAAAARASPSAPEMHRGCTGPALHGRKAPLSQRGAVQAGCVFRQRLGQTQRQRAARGAGSRNSEGHRAQGRLLYTASPPSVGPVPQHKLPRGVAVKRAKQSNSGAARLIVHPPPRRAASVVEAKMLSALAASNPSRRCASVSASGGAPACAGSGRRSTNSR